MYDYYIIKRFPSTLTGRVLTLITLITCWTEASGLTGVKISLPAAVSPGDTATLVCHYDLEGEPLYTIKWYKGREEFYRYVPKEHPETQVFPLPGIDVDVGMSGDGRVVLREVSSELTGKYRCEVSADAPNFHTKVVSAHMRVVKKLEGDPMLVLEKTRYTVGDMLRGNCTSPAHIPSANLTVFINGRKVNTSFLERKSDNYKRIRTTVGINYLVLTAGGLRIQCVADLYNAFTTQTELVLEEDRPRLASVLGTRDSGSVGSKTLSNFSCIIFLLINVLMVYLR
ncbi:uncharacterized protein LOC142322993 [Lycorma delicatula]|uniref:uncharacterized protein LOC142322993 n=1 Tax=Lycorma delicatula TaxID=130591 RepID=UPI003F518431